VYLLLYSPDLNLIEEAFSQIKGVLPRAEARTNRVPVKATSTAINGVGAQDAQNFFEHCGYRAPGQPL
jgi:hypothetical protein